MEEEASMESFALTINVNYITYDTHASWRI